MSQELHHIEILVSSKAIDKQLDKISYYNQAQFHKNFAKQVNANKQFEKELNSDNQELLIYSDNLFHDGIDYKLNQQLQADIISELKSMIKILDYIVSSQEKQLEEQIDIISNQKKKN
jgi:hypothetical protein